MKPQSSPMLQNTEASLSKQISNAIIRSREETLMHVGSELHDNVNQLLVSANLYLNMVKPSEDTEKFRQKGQDLLKEAIMQIQFLSRGMATPKLPGNALIANVNALLNHIRETTPLQVYFIHSLNGRQISGAKGLALFRIIQEQIKNVLSHSGATSLTISLCADASTIKLVMQDNGKGINEQVCASGIGLKNIEHRVQAFDGTATVTSKPGKGYQLKVMLPRKVYGQY